MPDSPGSETRPREAEPSAPTGDRRIDPSLRGGLRWYFGAIGILALARIALGFVWLPLGVLPYANLAIAALFLALPIVGLFFAANHPWRPATAWSFLFGGLAVHGLSILIARNAPGVGPIAANVVGAAGQAGLATWCVGLGALLATLVRDKNILLPIAIFLAVYDKILVLTPVGVTQKIMEQAPEVLETVGMQIPAVQAEATGGAVIPGAYVGPADLVFLGMFFIALFRFRMRARETLRWMIPALIFYLFVVLFTGFSLPAMVPIGLVLVAVNWREFKLNRDEKIATFGLAAIAVAVFAWAVTRPRTATPAGPSPTAVDRESPGSAAMPGPATGGPPPSSLPSAPESRPDPR